MSTKKFKKLWVINVTSFTLLMILSGTGLINWLILPKGFEARGSFLISIRHIFITVHEWTALIFIIVIAIHIGLHWKYVKANIWHK